LNVIPYEPLPATTSGPLVDAMPPMPGVPQGGVASPQAATSCHVVPEGSPPHGEGAQVAP
jgi:hypothetical protein